MTDYRVLWTIVAFNHPKEQKSVLYRQGLSVEGLGRAIVEAIGNGANLMSIRGFDR